VPEVATPLSAWESFYVIVGSSGAALTGLQFVVITLVADSRRQSSMHEIRAFGTPTVVHFCAVLLMSAVLSCPWNRLSSAGIALGLIGAAGLLYSVLVLRRALRAPNYKPVLEDWIAHVILPLATYGALIFAGFTIRRHPDESLFVIGAAALLLLFIGIHNAWDTVTYIAVEQRSGGRTANSL
jgi:hypothetical protein